MKPENNVTVQAGPSISISGLLGVAFIILKLCGVIAWSWWWVLAPFWIPVALLVLFFAGIILIPLGCIAAVGLFSIVRNLFRK